MAYVAHVAYVACVLAVGACGGDDSNAGTMVTDAGAMKSDGGANGGTGGQSQSIPRRDAQVAEDPIVACDIEAPKCPAGEVCDVLLRRAAGETDFTLELGCVKAGRERAEGDPCDLDPSDDGEPYTVPGLKDTIYREPCGPGLTCAPSPQTRGASAVSGFAPAPFLVMRRLSAWTAPFCRTATSPMAVTRSSRRAVPLVMRATSSRATTRSSCSRCARLPRKPSRPMA